MRYIYTQNVATPFQQEGCGLLTKMCGESCAWLPRSVLPAYAMRSVVGTLSLSTSATERQAGLFSCAVVGVGLFL